MTDRLRDERMVRMAPSVHYLCIYSGLHPGEAPCILLDDEMIRPVSMTLKLRAGDVPSRVTLELDVRVSEIDLPVDLEVDDAEDEEGRRDDS